jgi:hypothetical protein
MKPRAQLQLCLLFAILIYCASSASFGNAAILQSIAKTQNPLVAQYTVATDCPGGVWSRHLVWQDYRVECGSRGLWADQDSSGGHEGLHNVPHAITNSMRQWRDGGQPRPDLRHRSVTGIALSDPDSDPSQPFDKFPGESRNRNDKRICGGDSCLFHRS